jgi:SRP-independent targeting protein 2/TMEM208
MMRCPQIPIFVIYKLWNIVSPMLFGRSSSVAEGEPKQEGLSKRQEKMKKRSERGDPRVKVQVRK